MNGAEEICSAFSIYVLMFATVCDEYEIFKPRRKIRCSEIDCWSVTQILLFVSAWQWNDAVTTL
jgi:hypothetical protein